MPLDAICLSALTNELNEKVSGARIDKVIQPARDEIQLAMRGSGGSFRLLLSASARNPRVHITEIARENPAVPPMFCMLLRKHLTGARFVRCEQPPMERVLILILDTIDEMGIPSQKKLVCEVMGRHANIVLVDAEGRIVDCMKRVDAEMSEKRQVLPGLFYRLPPKQEKLNPLELPEHELDRLLEAQSEFTDKWLLSTFEGLSPLICRELIFRGMPQSMYELLKNVKASRFNPFLMRESGTPREFSFMRISQYGDLYQSEDGIETFSELLDIFYTQKDMQEQMKQRAASLMKYSVNQRDRLARKLELQKRELEKATDREHLRQTGDLLMANLHLIDRGMPSVTVPDFYHPLQADKTIVLDAQKSPQQNAARYYRDYAKAKNAEIELNNQIKRGQQDIIYWDSVIEEISRVSNEKELRDIRDELSPSHAQKKRKEKASMPEARVSSEGITYFIGKNNKQNDHLTTKIASKNDIWLHAQKIPGAHVIIDTSSGEPGDATLLEAASAAAYYSQGRNSPKVSVDYTLVKYVKKPGGAKPGMVIYDRFKTVFVEPEKQGG